MSNATCVFILVCLIVVVQGQNCSIPPLSLAIQNTTFSDGIAVNRGVQTLLGGQLLGLRLSLSQNNTRVRNARDCSVIPANFSACQGASGGVFNVANNSFTQVPLSKWNVSVVDRHPQDATIIYGYSSSEFPDSAATIDELPFEVWADANAANKSELALGPSSSFFQRLVEASWAPTRNFGIYHGSRSQNQARDGELVIGGIDVARFDASTPPQEFPIAAYGASTDCPLQVMLSDVVLTNVNGNFSLFKDPAARVPACIDTIQNAFTFTKAMYAEWAQLTQHIDYDGSNYTAQTYPADREPLIGHLTVTLSNGYTSVIPHYELVSQQRGSDAQGKYSVTNASRIMAAVQTGQGDLGVDVPLLGGTFLSQNYLRVDYDQNKFWLSKAIIDDSVSPSIETTCEQTSVVAGNSGQGASVSSASNDIGLKVGLPVAFVVVATGLFGFWLFKRRSNSIITGQTDTPKPFRKGFIFAAKSKSGSRRDTVDDQPISPDFRPREVSEVETIEKPMQLTTNTAEVDRFERWTAEPAELASPTGLGK
ncbi:hypothetical protein PFICI_06102 [Pestalotiopsis fici W106-1]|uniref:Peptidase A1 domain-containing protein n=1 Tax=Pestalotiopsis fici (strain W106-1 / CGMCC3.15140) TaxID=1229662 RepID=W3X4W6_PESFW|nr:uncharacterized protein PFICI_06102 [Pestalotiopsis fici W106-1]ETS81100.1 hypothetical protein PFICI_06102 [Pestalotiopsis fici W106-1]